MDDFYVNIDEPSQKRRVLLQSSRDLLSALKLLEEFLDVKEEKIKLFNQISLVFDELAVLNDKLDSKIPRAGMPAETEPKARPLPKFRVKEYGEVKAAKTKLDILEEELSAIEDKISRLE